MSDNLKKILKALPTGVQEEIEAMDELQLRDRIVQSENNIRTAQDELAANEQYQTLRNAVKEVSGPTKDALKTQRAIIAYSLAVLESKGKL